LVLRIPSIIAGTVFSWLLFGWLTYIFDRTAGWIGLIFAAFLPPLVALSSEVRQYALLLCFLAAATYLLQCALTEESAVRMLLSSAFLYLAMFTHYSALLFVPAVAAYAFLWFLSVRPRPRMLAAWAVGQAGALGLFFFLYRTHISRLARIGAAHQAAKGWMYKSFFHPGRDHLLLFAIARSFGVFQFILGQLAVGDFAGLLFIAGLALLWKGKKSLGPTAQAGRQLGIFLVLPFALNCALAIAGIYPYGGTRHSAFLAISAVAGVSLLLSEVAQEHITRGVTAAAIIVAICILFGVPHRPYMLREDQSSGNMSRALDSVRRQVSIGGVVFLDFQSNFLFKYYLCPDVIVPADGPAPAFWAYPCAGYRVIYTGPETTIFTADTFLHRCDEMVRAYGLKHGDTVWVFQAGWDVGLARELQDRFPEFQELNLQSFGGNINLFELTVGEGMLSGSSHSN
jgi:Dolichyl-phosphate-mannose-protein mannosyltransferase